MWISSFERIEPTRYSSVTGGFPTVRVRFGKFLHIFDIDVPTDTRIGPSPEMQDACQRHAIFNSKHAVHTWLNEAGAAEWALRGEVLFETTSPLTNPEVLYAVTQ